MEQEARAAKLEIQRRIISVDRSGKLEEGSSKGSMLVLLASALFVPTAALALYFSTDSPTIPSVVFLDRADEIADLQEVEALTQQLRGRLVADENGGPTDGWILLGETYMRMGKFGNAADSFGQLLDRADVTSGMFSRYAEALIMEEVGTVTQRAEWAIDYALKLEPVNPAGTYYKAIALEQAGRPTQAHALLLARLEHADGYSPWMESYVGLANFLAQELGTAIISLGDYAPTLPRPIDQDIASAADMTSENRQAFIESMVERLATRLEKNSDDLDGWLQLARAYTVLGREDDALSTYRRAAPLVMSLPKSDPRKQQVRSALGVGE